jgi:protein-disulfide isomerase
MSKSSSHRTQRRAAQTKAARLRSLRYAGIAIIVLAAIAGLAIWRNAKAVPVEELTASVRPNLAGSPSAPVQIVEYGDLTCSSCRQWHNLGIKEQLQAQFGDQISFEFRHFPVITLSSPTGAEAAQCAAEQEGFWAFHDYIYENLEAYPSLTQDRVRQIATELGFDSAAFDTCLSSGRYRAFVNQAIRDGQAAGVRGTPTFFVNGQQTFPSFEGMVEAISTALNN